MSLEQDCRDGNIFKPISHIELLIFYIIIDTVSDVSVSKSSKHKLTSLLHRNHVTFRLTVQLDTDHNAH